VASFRLKPDSLMQRRMWPASHTSFSWFRGALSRTHSVPKSHTRFSWRSHSAATSTSASTKGVAGSSDDKELRYDYLVDVDANFLSELLDADGDTEQHITAANAVNVKQFVLPCSCVGDLADVLDIAKRFPGIVLPCAGVHPYWSFTGEKWPGGATFSETLFAEVRKYAKLPQVLAVGECGLDYSPQFPPSTEQHLWFDRQVSLAAEVHRCTNGCVTIHVKLRN